MAKNLIHEPKPTLALRFIEAKLTKEVEENYELNAFFTKVPKNIQSAHILIIHSSSLEILLECYKFEIMKI